MKLPCPSCGKFSLTDCINVIADRYRLRVWRRRKCRSCGKKFSTVEEKTATRSSPKEKPA